MRTILLRWRLGVGGGARYFRDFSIRSHKVYDVTFGGSLLSQLYGMVFSIGPFLLGKYFREFLGRAEY